MKIPGVRLNIGGTDYIVPALNFRILRQVQPRLHALTSMAAIPDDEQLNTVIDIVLMALQRNYPDMTRETLEEAVDLDNLKEIVAAIMGLSGLKKELPDSKLGAPAENPSAGAMSTDS